jgi:outer membrane protein TolC
MKLLQFRVLVLLLAGTATCTGQVLTIEDAVRMAVKANRQVKISELDVTKAGEVTAETRTLRAPQLNSYVVAGGALNPITSTIPMGSLGVYPGVGPIPGRDAEIQAPRRLTGLIFARAAQPVTQLFFKIPLAIQESKLGEELAGQNLRQQKLEIARQVREGYYQLVGTQAQVASAESALRYLVELQTLVDRNLAEETVLNGDSLNVRTKVSQQRYQLLQLQNALDCQKEALNRLLGRELNTPFTVEEQPLATFDELDLPAAQKKAIEHRPEIRKARLQEEKSEIEIRRERAEYWPDLSLQVSYLAMANFSLLPTNVSSAGFIFEWKPYDFGQKKHKIALLKASSRQANLTAQDAEQQIQLDVATRYRKLMEARALLATQTLSQEAEHEKLRVITNRYGEKAVLLTDVLQEQAALAQADSQYRAAVAGFWSAKADFERSLGEEF